MASTASQNKKRRLDDGQIYVRACHINTRKHREPYLTPENLSKLRITVCPLDLSSGDDPDYGPRFIEPIPWGEMNEFVEHNRPWESYQALEPLSETADLRKNPGVPWARGHRFHEGRFMHLTLEHFANEFLGYSMLGYNSPELRYKYFLDANWCILCYTMRKDPSKSKPHINAFVTDGEPLLPDRLTTGEVSIAYGLITQRRWKDGYNAHRYIPVNIFSASDRQMRILQVWHDKENPKALQVRRTPIMEFPDGMRANWKDWISILCFYAGKPVGETVDGK